MLAGFARNICLVMITDNNFIKVDMVLELTSERVSENLFERDKLRIVKTTIRPASLREKNVTASHSIVEEESISFRRVTSTLEIFSAAWPLWAI